MAKRITTADFIERAKAVHGDRYDYSLAEYQGIHKYVTIVCAEHGPFQQSPANHYHGKGCSDCGGSKPHTTESFVDAAKAVHGDRYDYSIVKYSSNKAHVTIICSDHGPFSQIAAVHLRGNGCPQCGGNRKHSAESFIEKVRAVHGDRYDYSQAEYEGAHTPVTIICPDHGLFMQSPSNHFAGKGCPECGKLAASEARRKTTEQFIAKANAIHGNRYDYSLVEYLSAMEKVTIICPEHGPFEQTPNGHVEGKGCYECGIIASSDAKRSTIEQFIAKARMVHGELYDYSLAEYVTSSKKVKIICPDHGLFLQTPNDHIVQRSGCPNCAQTGFSPSKTGLLYYLAITTDDGDTLYKIGITNLSIEERFRGADLARIRVVKIWRFAIGRLAVERESEILYQFAGDRYYGPRLLVGAGNTELFTHDILGLDGGEHGHGQSAVDEDANLISRQLQSSFDF